MLKGRPGGVDNFGDTPFASSIGGPTMTLPAPDESSHESTDSAADAAGTGERPDWLLGMEDDVAGLPASRPPAANKFVLRQPSPPPSDGKIEGLVGSEVRTVDPVRADAPEPKRETIQAAKPFAPPVERVTQIDVQVPLPAAADQPAAAVPQDKPLVAWSAAASSIPQLRMARTRAAGDAEIAASAQEFVDPDEEEPLHSGRLSGGGLAPRSPRPVARPVQSPMSEAIEKALAQLGRFVAIVPRFAWFVAGGLVVAAIGAIIAFSPREHFDAVRTVCANARTLDGRVVHVRGVVGQTFMLGGGYLFYLHDGRDSLAVYTLTRTPVERSHIKLFGTVSTGYLDGEPRAAVFENKDQPPATN